MKDSLYLCKDYAKIALSYGTRSYSTVRRQKMIVLFTFVLSAVFSSTSFSQQPKFFSPGGGDSCRVHPQYRSVPALQPLATAEAVVRLAYVVPSNRTAQPNAVSNFQHVIKTAQQWYREQMEQNGFGAKTFTVETEADGVTPMVHVVHVPETDAQLRGNGDGYDVWNNTTTATSNAGISLWAIGEVWVVIPEVHLMLPDGRVTGEVALGAGFGTSNRPGLTMISSKALALFEPSLITNDTPYDGQVIPAIGPYPMKQDVTFGWFEGNTLSAVVSSWTGALFHEMGHAFGLAHDFRNDNNFNGNLMGNGLRGVRGSLFPEKYPQDYTRLEYTSALILNVGHFFNNGKVETPSPTVSLDNPPSVIPERGLANIAFQTSDNDSLSVAHLRYNGEAVAELVLNGLAADTTFAVPYFTPGTDNHYTLAVVDKQGNATYTELQFNVPAGYNQAPFPFIRIDPPVPVLNQPVTFDASQSYDADNDISSLLVAWDVDNDGEFDTEPTANRTFQYDYQFGDNYLVRMKVIDPTGAETISTPVSVKVPGEKKVAVESFTLINANSDKSLGELKNDMVINLAVSEVKTFSVRANVSTAKIHRVKFDLKGPFKHQRTETKTPYTLFGETGYGNIMGREFPVGEYQLTATPYTSSGKGVSLTVSFRVIQEFVPGKATIVWDKTIGGAGRDIVFKAISTSDGGYLLAGNSSSEASGDKSENNKGLGDYWIVKLDSERIKQWDRTYGGADIEELRDVVATSDGGYLLAGFSSSNASGDKTENSKGYGDFWVLKIDASGNKVWDKTLGGMYYDMLYSAINVPDGGYLLAGTSWSDISGDKTENSKGTVDYWVIKIDDQGNKIWDRTFGGDSDDDVRDVIATPGGGFLIGGSSGSRISGDKTKDPNGPNDDYWLVKTDGQGNKEWDKTIGGFGRDVLQNIIVAPDGGYLLTGFSNSDASIDKSENGRGVWDFWVVKTDAAGNKVWDRTFGGYSNDEAAMSIVTPDGGYLVAGSSSSPISPDKSEDIRGEGDDFWIIKIDQAGNKIWDKTIGGTNHEWPVSATLTRQHNYLLAGPSASTASGEKSENSQGDYDYWIVEIKPPATLAVTSFALMNAQTNNEIRKLNDGDVIDLLETHASLFNMRADATGNNITKVVFDLNGPLRINRSDKTSPYSVFGDHNGNYNGRKLIPGQYTLAATPFSGDVKGTTLSISFTVTEGFEITGFTLIDATENRSLSPLSDGGVIDMSQLNGHKISIQANIEPTHLDKVAFVMHGPIIYANIEQVYPYTLFGETTDRNGVVNYAGLKLVPGFYTLEAIPYTHGLRGTSQTIAFTVIDDKSSISAHFKVEVFPIPASGVVNIIHEGKAEQAYMTLLNPNGNILMNCPLSQGSSEQLDVSMYKKGLYYLRVTSNEGVQIIRFAIE